MKHMGQPQRTWVSH